MNKPLILITNDDGIAAKGLESLVECMQKFGQVIVVAPDKPQSGMGHAITINHPLRMKRSKLYPEIEAYSTTGTPVDCVKLGIYEIAHRKPDLLVSGINHGANFSSNVLYSGTMSAAVEGAMENIPSIGFSLCDFDEDADFTGAMKIVDEVTALVLRNEFPKHVCLNVNIPKLPASEIKGIKICKQAAAFWDDRFEERKDPFGHSYYWMTGKFQEIEVEKDTDLHFIQEGYATIVPTQFDMTAYAAINTLKNWK